MAEIVINSPKDFEKTKVACPSLSCDDITTDKFGLVYFSPRCNLTGKVCAQFVSRWGVNCPSWDKNRYLKLRP